MIKFSRFVAACAAVVCCWSAFGVGVNAYVQENLVAVWDGVENDGTSHAHRSDVTQWKDCIADRPFELTGVAIADDHLYFNGGGSTSRGVLSIADSQATFDLCAGGTLEIVLNCENADTENSIALHGTTASGMALGWYTGGKCLLLSTGHGGQKGADINWFNATKTISLAYSNALPCRGFQDGEECSLNNVNNNWGDDKTQAYVGSRSIGTLGFKGSIYCIRLYSAQLTPEQIAANHAVDVERFANGNYGREDELVVSGTPEGFGEVSPAYGSHGGYSAGRQEPCTAPAAWTSEDGLTKATCVGYKVYTNNVVYVEGSSNSFTYEHPDCETGAKLVWLWTLSYNATATAGEHGSVTSTSAWLKDGESTEVTATAKPDDGYVFTRWEGDLGEASPLENPIKVVMTPEKRSLVAVFGQKIVVAADGSGAYTNLEEAVTAANSNDVIVIRAGNYPIRDKNMTFFSINKAVTIVSESGDPKDVHLHGFGPWNDMKYAGGNFQNNGYKLDHKYAILNGVTLRKFTSDNPGDGQDLALRIVNGLAENVVISNCVGNHKVTGVRLYGGEIRNSLICANKGNDQDEASGVDAQGGIVRNCTIRGNSSPGCAVKVQAASAKVVDCQIISNTGGDTNGGGLKLTNGLVENCVISNNTGASAGVYMTGGTLKGCLVTGNTANYARKFGGVNATGGTIEDCTIFANTAYYPDGMQLKMTGGTVKGTTVAAKFDAIPCSDYVSVASGVTVENSTFQCPSVNGSTELNASDVFAEREFHIHADKVVGLAPLTVNFSAAGTAATPSWNFGDETVSSEATPSHTFEKAGRYTVTLTAGGDATTLDILALSTKTYVGKGSATFPYDTEEKATPDFQAAHDAVYADDTVHGTVEVLADTYTYAGSDVSSSFKPWLLVNKNVTVEGATGNRDDVVFDAKQKIMTTFLFHPKAVLKDLTISNGRFNSSSAYGATLHMMEGLVTNCVISKGFCNFGGNATIRGGGIIDSVFKDGKVNRAGPDRPGGGLDVYGAVTVAGCVFEGNDGDYGGGLYMNNGSCIVSNCVIRNNTCGGAGGGVVLNGGLLTHCVITNNSVNSDGGGLYLITGTARNCLIAGNKANKTSAPSWGYGGSGGGGVAMANGTLENCTVAFNKSESSTRCDELSMQNGTVRNCVFLGKDDDGACDVYKTGGTATYSSFRKEIAGTGNIKDDVKMVRQAKLG